MHRVIISLHAIRATMFLVLMMLIITQNVYAGTETTYKKIIRLMGSRFEIGAVSDSNSLAWKGIKAAIQEITRIEKLISSWDVSSETSEINRNAGIKPVPVSRELYDLVYRCKKVSELTDGGFDISFAAVDHIWKFDRSVQQLPTAEIVASSVSRVNYKNIILDRNEGTVFLKKKGMKIGFGAIGKGYAANRAKEVMKKVGISSGVVNAGGDLTAWGKQEDGSQWKIGIADPKNKSQILAWLTIEDMSVVTSGDYEKYFISGGIRYSHIINPKTGYPVTGIKSVTIVCPDAELADAIATGVFVMGDKRGLELIDQLNGIECLIINAQDEITTSKNLQLHYYRKSDPAIPNNFNLTIGKGNEEK
jgi:thiamine biosynthesis lipoprotein